MAGKKPGAFEHFVTRVYNLLKKRTLVRDATAISMSSNPPGTLFFFRFFFFFSSKENGRMK